MIWNERAVGRAIKEDGIKREDIFLSSKLWSTVYEEENAIDDTLKRLGVDYIDLLFLHQRRGSQHGDLKKAVVGASGFYQMLSANYSEHGKYSLRVCCFV